MNDNDHCPPCMDKEVSDESAWLGWKGVQIRIEDAYYDSLVDFAFAVGELTA